MQSRGIRHCRRAIKMEKGNGVLGALAGGPAAYQKVHQEFIPSECFPFTKKEKKNGAWIFHLSKQERCIGSPSFFSSVLLTQS